MLDYSQLVRIIRHPTEHWAWFVATALAACALIVGGILVNRRIGGMHGNGGLAGSASPSWN